MHVVHHAHLSREQHDGETRLCAAGPAQGIAGFELWLSTLEPGAATRELRHAAELVAVAQQGGGKLLIDGGPQRFHAPCSLLIPRGCVFRIVNNGSSALQLVWVGTGRPAPARADAADPPDPENRP